MRQLLFLFFLLGIAQIGLAQDFEGYYTASFDFNTPISNTKLINSTSIGGVKVGYHRLLNEKFSIGGEINWGTYKQYHPTNSFPQTNGSIVTTDYFNYVYAYGFVLSGRYYRSYNHKINPFVGAGLGGAYNKYTQFYNVYENQQKSGGFLIRPEAGAIIRFNQRKSISGLIGIHYDYSTSSNPKLGYNSDFSNWGINVGVVFLDW